MGQQSCGVREVATRLGCTLKHAYTLVYEGKLPGARKQAGRWWIPVRAVEARLRVREAGSGTTGR